MQAFASDAAGGHESSATLIILEAESQSCVPQPRVLSFGVNGQKTLAVGAK
jgi:hypothetical protein